MGLFSGIRVLDLSRVLAGPYCGQMLADFGADVIKIEDVSGDENRHWAPVVAGVGVNYASVNRGKRGLTLNLKSDGAQQVLRKLIAGADIVIDSFLPPVASRLGVDDTALRAIKPDIIHVTISGYGHEGPLAGRPGYDLMLQAFSGVMEMTGEPDGGPIRSGASFVDMTTGLIAYSGAVAALYARETGQAPGQHVQVSLLETAIALLGYHIPGLTMAGKPPQRNGSGVWHIVPYQAFKTIDGYLLAGATNDATWQRMCRALGADTLANTPDFATAVGRVANREAITDALGSLFAGKTTEEWLTILDAHNVPCSPVNTLAETLAHPQIKAMKMLVDAQTQDGTPMSLVGVPLNLSSTPAQPGAAPPELGQDTDSILDELGYDMAEIARLRASGDI